MKIAFHKGVTPWDWAIRLFSGGPFSHCELVFSDGLHFGARPFRKVNYIHRKTDETWTAVDIPCSDGQERQIRKWCDGEVGSGYDWWGIARFVLKFIPASEDDWFCSEICTAALQQIFLLPNIEPQTIHPVGLYNLCGKMK